MRLSSQTSDSFVLLHEFAQTVTLTAGTEYTFSVWARAASGTENFRLAIGTMSEAVGAVQHSRLQPLGVHHLGVMK